MANEKQPTIKLRGKIQATEQVGTDRDNFPIIETILLTPAVDQYSHPNRYCIKSRAKIGDVDAEVAVEANVICRPWKDNQNRWRYPHELWAA